MASKLEKARQLANLGKSRVIEGEPMVELRINHVTVLNKQVQPLKKKEYKYIDPNDIPPKEEIPYLKGYTVADLKTFLDTLDPEMVVLGFHQELGYYYYGNPNVITLDEGEYINEEEVKINTEQKFLIIGE